MGIRMMPWTSSLPPEWFGSPLVMCCSVVVTSNLARGENMSGNWFSARGNSVGNEMSTEALTEAKGWYKALLDVEFRGRGDREKSVRGRLSKSLGIAESYLFRLQYKAHEMKDVAGEAYRRLKIAYDNACEKNEQAAARYRAERLSMDGNNETAVEEPHAQSVGTVSAGAASDD